MKRNRQSGILTHPTSFPSPYGIGDLGAGAAAHIDFLAAAKQTLWQTLPLNPTSFGDSPYQSFSTFAGNPLLISPDKLVDEGLLPAADAEEAQNSLGEDERSGLYVDYGAVIARKNRLYKKAYKAFAELKRKPAYTEFCKQNKDWLDDYCLFMALKGRFITERCAGKNDAGVKRAYDAFARECEGKLTAAQADDCFFGAAWISWPADIRGRERAAVKTWSDELADEIAFRKFLQFTFFKQWAELKDYAGQNGITIIGDVPIFVAYDSADVWKDRQLFELDAHGWPVEVAGVPPDYFTATGQLWGNPLYDWDAHRKQGYGWWTRRVEQTLKTVDLIRIDHFRGFEGFWSVPFGEETAVDGKWRKGPGAELFLSMKAELGVLPLIAEDLGVITDKVERLRDRFGLPGMRVVQFAFGGENSVAIPHNFETANCVVYPGTHDNDTVVGWYQSTHEGAKDHFRRYLNVSGEDPAWDMIRLVFLSAANRAVVQLQDVLSLGNEARMNCPGTAAGNWRFRYTADMLKPEHAEKLAYLSKLSDRNAEQFAEKAAEE